MNKIFFETENLSVRSLIIGAVGSIIISASSMYVSLRMSALPWPTIFVAILSLTVLKILGKTDLNEVNVTQTAMSAGSMVAGGLAFTVPGLFINGIWSFEGKTNNEILLSFIIPICIIAIAGVILGTLLCWLLRKKFIEEDNLPYPIGTAAADAIKVTENSKAQSVLLFSAMGISGVFVWLRDKMEIIPQFLAIGNFSILLMPMATGIGFIVGILNTFVWFLGAVFASFIVPLLITDPASAGAFKSTAGIGVMIGVGMGVFIKFLYSQIKSFRSKNASLSFDRFNIHATLILTIIAYILTVLSGLNLIMSILVIIGVAVATSMAASSTGQTGINPMEIFAIIVMLSIRVFIKVTDVQAFLIAAVVAVACGYAGDLMNDYKAGHIIGTNPKALVISQFVGGIFGTLVAVPVMFLLINSFGGVGTESLPAAQATMTANMINGIGDPAVFYSAFIIGLALCLLNLPVLTLGLGIYLPFVLSSAIFLGGALSVICNKFFKEYEENGRIIASGLLGGESIVGVLIALISMFLRA